MSYEPVENFAKVTVLNGYSDTDTTIALDIEEAATLPDPAIVGSFWVTWWNESDYPDPSEDPNKERIEITAIDFITGLATIVRAQDDTLASVKNILTKTYRVVLAFAKRNYDNIYERIELLEETAATVIYGTTTEAEPDPANYHEATFLWLRSEGVLKIWDLIAGVPHWREVGGAAGGNKYGSAKYGTAKYG